MTVRPLGRTNRSNGMSMVAFCPGSPAGAPRDRPAPASRAFNQRWDTVASVRCVVVGRRFLPRTLDARRARMVSGRPWALPLRLHVLLAVHTDQLEEVRQSQRADQD